MIPERLRAFATRNSTEGELGRVWIEQRGEMSLKPGAWPVSRLRRVGQQNGAGA